MKWTLCIIALTLFGCTHEVSQSTCPLDGFQNGNIAVLTTNYETSSLDIIDLACEGQVTSGLVVASGDSVLRASLDGPAILNRGLESNVLLLSDAPHVSLQVPLNDCGPHDIIRQPNTEHWLVSCYESHQLVRIKSDGETIESVGDLRQLAGEDGIPEMDALALDDDYIYVSIQNLNRFEQWNPEGPGMIAVLNRETLELEQTIELPCTNPYTRLLQKAANQWVVGCAGNWSGSQSGIGVALVDTTSMEATLLASHAELGGRPAFLGQSENGTTYIVTATPNPDDPWDIESMQVVAIENGRSRLVLSKPGYSLGGVLSIDQDTLMVAVRTLDEQAGAHLVDVATGATLAHWKTGLAPIEFVRATVQP